MITYTAQHTIPEEEAKAVAIAYLKQEITQKISGDGHVQVYECTSYHNNEWGWVKTSLLADKKEWEYNEALKKVVEYLKGEKNV